ncbi:YbaB/EbfC family nucleoid-associated protein [Hymenobacter oligotrophus]|uniref:Nucleoid-associated protein D3Y59_06105 n=2 Tax=Cytophagales TaxID=768507 RepID=A0A3B7QYI9_9BACT|nr:MULTISPECIES: YbaB/EbfC family nucleoid-associated protein [Cytophagales]AYA36665.1 YbaB/EbfC family nucleoid-associated protein [Hymenobacter oligotrophus]KUG07476.1 DNA-binding protein [Solirubrum puertoriconensis]UYZ60561.1 YbaB/EbfC family nucleoid-associated protein [Hymenobacter sp. YIM 151858-1]
MFDMMGMMGRFKDLQEKVKQAQEELKNITATAEAGGGMVRATANGKRQLLKLEIDETLLSPQDKDMVADLVVAAVNKVMDEVNEKSKEHMKQRTSGLLPNIPGLDLSGFGL